MKRLTFSLLVLCIAEFALAIDHYRIYPAPHEISAAADMARISPTVYIIAGSGVDATTVARAKAILEAQNYKTEQAAKPKSGSTSLMLGIYGSADAADAEATRLGIKKLYESDRFWDEKANRYEHHVLSLHGDKNGVAQILLLGESTDAVFRGLASLRQIIADKMYLSPKVTGKSGKKVKGDDVVHYSVFLRDYADIRDRGVIEGYYGVPYSAEVTKDLFRFMADYKMNTYMYGAKSDPYHSRFWADPYPTTITEEQRRIGYLTQDMMRDITSVARANKVDFIWAIHPGTAFTDPANERVLDQIMHKFEAMHELGVRQFGVFVDDVGVPSDDALLRLGAERLTELQRRIDARWNGPGANPADTVKPLHYVPQLYAFSWVSAEQGERFFRSLANVPDKVRIYITGRNVWSVPNSGDLWTVKQWLGHDTSWWWNYPCNDNDFTKLFIADTYTNFRDEKHIQNNAMMESRLRGTQTLISNPMQQGEASKIALFSIADYAWNGDEFDNRNSWEAALSAVVGSITMPALRDAIPYLRYYDSDALSYLAAEYRRSCASGQPYPYPLLWELGRVRNACSTLKSMDTSDDASQRLFYEDIRPWVLKLDAMLAETCARLKGTPTKAVELNDNPDFQFPILTGLGADIQLSTRTAEPAAEVLQPLLLWLRERDK